MTDRQTETKRDRDRQTDRQAGRQAGRKTDRQTDKHTDRPSERASERERERERERGGGGLGGPGRNKCERIKAVCKTLDENNSSLLYESTNTSAYRATSYKMDTSFTVN